MTAILVVEDEPIIREATAAMLARCGFALHTAGTSDDALVLVSRVQVDIVLADIFLQGSSDGYGMAQQLRRSGWSGRVIFTSGDPYVAGWAKLADEQASFLPKPYGRQMLLGAINEVRGT